MLLNEKVDASNSIQNKCHVLASCGYSLNDRRAEERQLMKEEYGYRSLIGPSVRGGYYVEPSINSA